MGLTFAETLMDLLPLVKLLQTGVESIVLKCGPRLHLGLQTAPQKLQAFSLVVNLPARVSGHSRLFAWLAARSSRGGIDATDQGTWLMLEDFGLLGCVLWRILKFAIVLSDAVFIALVANSVVSVIRYLLFSLLLWRRLLVVELLDADSGLASGCRRR